MNDLIVVSNRGPAMVLEQSDNTLAISKSAGGLAPSLVDALWGTDALWIAAPMTDLERQLGGARREPVVLTEGLTCAFVDLAPEVESASRVIANGVLWFLYHGIFDTVHRPIFDARSYEAWAGYRAYNRSFAESIASHAASGATVVVNDYHLSLVGSELAALRPDVRTVQFSHTPFCSPDELSVLPRALSSELLGGLSSFGSCGFHTKRWADAYRSCARSLSIKTPPPFVAPLGIDTKKLRQSALSPGVVAHREAMVKEIAGRQCIVRSDRIELSKNIVRGFLAFEELLVQNPSLRDRVVFIARMYASREELPEYLAYRAEIEHVVERINDRFSECSRPPILASIGDDQDASLAALSLYDVLLVNSIRDGMNLVAKEGALLNRREGVLVLSHEAGAFVELGDSALDVSPFDVSGTAAVMKTALTMPASERGARAIALAKRASAHPPKNWIESVVAHAALPSPKRS